MRVRVRSRRQPVLDFIVCIEQHARDHYGTYKYLDKEGNEVNKWNDWEETKWTFDDVDSLT